MVPPLSRVTRARGILTIRVSVWGAAMAKNLVIVESPAKAKTINKFIGKDYIVKASVGHVRDLPKSELGVDEVTFEPKYEVLEGKEKVVSELKAAAKKADFIYIASDIDMNKVNAQQARRVLDRLVGYKISPLLWDKVRRGLSAGRVQSVALKM